jgi:CoA:oxalate CoA-transferase
MSRISNQKLNESKLALGPLNGVRVLDFTMILAGPFGTRLLADMGAEVIKVEPPVGDYIRQRRPVRQGYSTVFGHLNAGKKSIVLDLKSKAGLKAALDIAKKSDVVVENWRPGVADRLGVGYQAIRDVNPKVVYCSLSGFGQQGPWSHRPAYAPIVHAASGYDLAQMEYQHGERPAKTGTFIGDVIGGLSAFAAIQSALYRQTQTGEGQFIDVSLLECMFNILIHECQEAQNPLGGAGRLYRPLKTTDGFVVVAPTSQNNFEQLSAVLGHPEWISDPKFRESKSREANWGELMDLIESWTGVRSGEQCEEILLKAGVPCTRYKTIAQAMEDPQSKARESFSTVVDGAGKYLVPRAPFQMPGLSTSVRPHFPELGEYTVEVLKELLGYSAEAIEACSKR